MRSAVGPDIYIRCHITNVKRDPKCDNTASWEEKIVFFDKVRAVGKELCEQKEHSNANNLYLRCKAIFENMPKKQNESLNDE